MAAAARSILFLTASLAVATSSGHGRRQEVEPAIQKVLTMLENLVSMMESEAQEDEAKIAHFTEWANGEISTTTEKIGSLNTKIENLNAALAELNARHAELSESTKKLNSDISMEEAQLGTATDKRNSEATAFAKESTDFENAIAACRKAVELLGAHYGDGTSTAQGKPSWMSLLNEYIGTARAVQKRVAGRKVAAFLQQEKQPNFEVYEDSSADAGNIVDQIKILGQTFQEDYDSSKDEEAKLKAAFEDLTTKKKKILSTLRDQRDEQQGMLNSVAQEKAETEGALMMNTETLEMEQAHLTTCKGQLAEFTSAYNARKKDRDEESEAVKKAIEVLGSATLIQTSKVGLMGTTTKRASAALVQSSKVGRWASRWASRRSFKTVARRLALKTSGKCQGCAKAAALLRERAKTLHSAVLSAAAATSMSSEVIDEVIDALKGLIKRIDQEHKTEREHKDWCEEETGLSTKKRDDHSYAIDDLKQVIAGLHELIEMKQQDESEKEDEIDDEDRSFEELSEIRSEDKAMHEEDVEDHVDAIQALNEAIEILANFYAKRNAKSLLQKSGRALLQEPSGEAAVELMSSVRKEFEEGKVALDQQEQEAVADFQQAKKTHIQLDNDLHHDKDVITTEEQTAQQNMDAADSDLESHQTEKQATESYLNQLGRSCYPLLSRFDERKKLRDEEKQAIKDAIKVLRNA